MCDIMECIVNVEQTEHPPIALLAMRCIQFSCYVKLLVHVQRIQNDTTKSHLPMNSLSLSLFCFLLRPFIRCCSGGVARFSHSRTAFAFWMNFKNFSTFPAKTFWWMKLRRERRRRRRCEKLKLLMLTFAEQEYTRFLELTLESLLLLLLFSVMQTHNVHRSEYCYRKKILTTNTIAHWLIYFFSTFPRTTNFVLSKVSVFTSLRTKHAVRASFVDRCKNICCRWESYTILIASLIFFW